MLRAERELQAARELEEKENIRLAQIEEDRKQREYEAAEDAKRRAAELVLIHVSLISIFFFNSVRRISSDGNITYSLLLIFLRSELKSLENKEKLKLNKKRSLKKRELLKGYFF